MRNSISSSYRSYSDEVQTPSSNIPAPTDDSSKKNYDNYSSVLLSNIPYKLKKSDLYEMLQPYKIVIEPYYIINSSTRLFTGKAIVRFDDKTMADKVIEEFNNKEIMGRNLFAREYVRKPSTASTPAAPEDK